MARSELKFILLLRGCLRYLKADALRAALWILGHFVPSRRLWVEGTEWVRDARDSVREQLYLEPLEIVHLFNQVEEDDWIGGETVNEFLWLVIDDPDGLLKLKYALDYSVSLDMARAAHGMFEIICFLAGGGMASSGSMKF